MSGWFILALIALTVAVIAACVAIDNAAADTETTIDRIRREAHD